MLALVSFCFIELACAQFGNPFDSPYGSYDDPYRNPYDNNPYYNPFGDQRDSRSSRLADSSLLQASDCVCRMRSFSRIVKGQIAQRNR